ncbi:MAG: DUF4276 family protein [Nitrospirae bacterium YQR-1]
MKKVFFFVEGQTESIFIDKLLNEYIGNHNLELKIHKYVGQYQIKKVLVRENPTAIYEVRIYDVSSSGSTVISKIKETAESILKNKGYDFIIGLHDLYRTKINGKNIERSEKKKVMDAFMKLFQNKDFYDRIKYVLAIMEIEAWFLMDAKMFCKIDSSLTHNFIKEKLGYDLINDDLESYKHPSKIIDEIFHLCGKSYKKHKDESYRISHNLDYADLCCSNELINKVESWKYFLNCINLVFELGCDTRLQSKV